MKKMSANRFFHLLPLIIAIPWAFIMWWSLSDNIWIAIVVSLICVFILFLTVRHCHSVHINDKTLIVKKMFYPSKTIEFSQIKSIDAFFIGHYIIKLKRKEEIVFYRSQLTLIFSTMFGDNAFEELQNEIRKQS